MPNATYMLLERIPYRIEHEEVVLQSYDPREPRHVEQLFEVTEESREHLVRWGAVWADKHRTRDDTAAWVREARARFEAMSAFHYAVHARESGRMVGGAGLHVRGEPQPFGLEIGYWTRTSELRRGWATAAARALTHVALTLAEAERVVIRVEAENRASRAIPPKLGYVFEGIARRGLRAGDRSLDAAIYSRIRSDP